MSSAELSSNAQEPLLDGNSQDNNRSNFKKIVSISLINGILYYAIAIDGGNNASTLFNLSGHSGHAAISFLSAGASIVYTMFTYKTLESLSLTVDSLPKAVFSFLAPFSAAAFLTAGKEGAELLHLDKYSALSIGITLFALRMLNSVDASVKFPHRLKETKTAWKDARNHANYPEMTRLIIVWTASIGYVLCTTDAIYNASEIVFSWFNINAQDSQMANFFIAGLGALGTLPLNVYWSHRGLRQLTFGGQIAQDGSTPDPTDRYTFLACLCVTPVILGILGGATASTGKVFGQLGDTSLVLRIIFSVMYAIFAGTPGMASLLREAPKVYTQNRNALSHYYQTHHWLGHRNDSENNTGEEESSSHPYVNMDV